MHEPTDHWVIRLRSLVGPEDSYNLNLNPIHRIILGFSGADVNTQLELEPSKIDERDWMGMSPLMWAALRADHVAVQSLLSHHASVSLKDNEDRTALHYACRKGSLACVNQLLDAGADPNVFDINHGTPLHDAMYQSLPHSPIEELVSALKEHGADFEARDNDGWTPIFRATESQNSSGIEALVKFGGDINALSDNESPAISEAIFCCDYQVIETLCKLGAHLCWATTLHSMGNVLKELAICCTVEAMNIFVASNCPLIDYDPDEIKFWFTTYRNQEKVYGRQFTMEEERAAFEKLLDKKGNQIDCGTKGLAQEEETLPQIENNFQDIDDQEQTESFEDALETYSHLNEVEIVEGSANAIRV
jgi:ankyrin repeat protein